MIGAKRPSKPGSQLQTHTTGEPHIVHEALALLKSVDHGKTHRAASLFGSVLGKQHVCQLKRVMMRDAEK